jgi:hypothetical protein
MTRLQQVGRYRAAHAAEPDKARFHVRLLRS